MWYFLMWNFLFLFLTSTSQWWVYLALPRAAVSDLTAFGVRIPFTTVGSWLGYLLPMSLPPVCALGVLMSSTTKLGAQMMSYTQCTQHRWMCNQQELRSSFPNASWLADHMKQKRKLCSLFSRQLVIQTSQAFYKQCWFIFATADVCVMRLAGSSHGLNSWPWNKGLVFLYCSSLYGTRLRESGSFEMFCTFHRPGRLYCLVITTKMFYVVWFSSQPNDVYNITPSNLWMQPLRNTN